MSDVGPMGRTPSWALRSFGTATTVGLFLVIVMGTLVTDTGSQLGCGHQWPLCHGRFLPGPAFHTLVEFSHRFVAGIVGLMIVAVAIWAWHVAGRLPEVRWLGIIGIGFVVVQSLLGAAAVLWPESPAVLAIHFGVSLTDLAGVLLLTVVLFQLARPPLGTGGGWRARPAPPGLTGWAWFTLVYVYGLVYLGAYVAHTGVGLACGTWPLCNGMWIPPLRGATGLDFAHRLGALGAAALCVWLIVLARRGRERRLDLYLGALWLSAAVAAQILSGALLVWSRLATGAVVLHGSLVSLLFGVISYICFQTLPASQPRLEHGTSAPGQSLPDTGPGPR